MVSLAVCSRKLRESLQETSRTLTRVSSTTHAFDMTTVMGAGYTAAVSMLPDVVSEDLNDRLVQIIDTHATTPT